mmetsp:Transcript_1868/g.2053  ORF Transcript_1868/g.2053 Transcript_1868/m.2053 type:complete len:255 (+) Transcript_1868:81-845(+)
MSEPAPSTFTKRLEGYLLTTTIITDNTAELQVEATRESDSSVFSGSLSIKGWILPALRENLLNGIPIIESTPNNTLNAQIPGVPFPVELKRQTLTAEKKELVSMRTKIHTMEREVEALKTMVATLTDERFVSLLPPMQNIPVFGEITFASKDVLSFNLPATIPRSAKSILLGYQIRTGSEAPSRSFWVHIWTTGNYGQMYNKPKFAARFGQNAISFDSENFWLPITEERKVHVQCNDVQTNNCHRASIYLVGYK